MESKPRLLTILDIVTVIMLLLATAMVFFYAPLEAVMGQVQRVFYFHLASFGVSAISFLVAAVVGIIYLVRGDRKWDVVSLSAVEIGIVFAFINIVTGSIWARPIWNTWWTWDPRLTSATVMLLIYIAYIMMRQGVEDLDRRARFGAIYAIVGFLSVLMTIFSTRLLRTIHPVVFGANSPEAQGSFDMTPLMLQTLLFSFLTFIFIFLDLLWHRIRLGRFGEKVEQLRLKTME